KVIGFTVDGAKPVHNMYVTTSAAKSTKYSTTYSNKVGKFNDYSDQEEYTYGQYFNTDVFIDVAYFDYNIDSVTVYDNGTPINVNWATDGGYGRGTIAISSEGYHEIKMSSVDKSGNAVTDSGSSALYFTIDKTDPELTTYLNGAEYSADNAHVEKGIAQVSISDANPDDDDIILIAVRELPAGGSDNSSYAGVNGLEFTLDGYYSVSYTVTDKAGNSSTATYGFYVDTESPVHNMYVTSENPPKFSSYKNTYSNPVGVFNARASQENYEYGQYYNGNVNVELNVFDYNLDWVYVSDNGVELSPTWAWNGAYGTATVTLMSEGYHELKMWSKDLSGNETDDTDPAKMIRLYIDKTAPGITTYVNGSLYSEGSGVRYLNTNASVQVSVNDTNKDTTDLVRTSKMTPPGGSASSSTENVGETTENYSTEADYEVQYVATDLAGNKSGTRNVQFRVDKTPPQLSITGDGTSTAKSVPVSFGIKEAFYWDMTSAKYSIYKKKDGTGESLEKTTDFTPRSSNDSQSYTITEDAEYRFEFSAEDKCGNKTETKGTLIKDGTAPIILLSGVSNYDKTDKEVTLNISVDEAFYSTNKVTLTGTRTDIDGKTTNIDFNQFTTNRTKVSQLEQLFKEDGIYDITVTSTDKAGNSSTKTLHFTIDTTDPEIGDLSKYDKVKTNKFEWDVDLDELVKDLTVCDISVYMDGSLYDGTTEIADGSHVLRVEAVDELGHKSYKEVTFVLDTKGPNIIISNVEDGDRLLESTEVTVTVEIDEDLLDTVSLNDKSVTVSENKATFTINSKGKYRINATAHDEAGNTSSTEIEFTFGKQANILLIAIIAGVAIILLIILMLLIKRRRENYY
ncbi:MAG: Ig-like domain-containing protein, partial [Eubacterium sp.]|nr:Ig-like domain-containing protein [Eubacterium sp.]